MHLTPIISKVNSWNDFKNVLESKSKLEKGNAFEELTKYYLQYNPVYKSKLKNIWLQKELTPSILKQLNLPTNDQGIDLIAETYEGTYWAIQCKYLQDEEQRLSHRAISTFVSLSTGIANNIDYCLVATTVDEYAKLYQGKTNIGFCNSDEWRKLDKTFFDWLRSKLKGKEKKLIAYKPKPHQAKALQEAKQYFNTENNNRGKLVFPCGAGKSLTGYWITKELNANNIIVAVPSLSLVKQTLEVYLRESVANNDSVAWLCVCSDEGIGKNDDVAIHTNEIGVPCVTNKQFIADWLIQNNNKKSIVFTTYQSGKTIAEACTIANHSFDLGIMDEAHKTVGNTDKLFSHLLFDENINIQNRIFMTATERRYAGSSDNILSMDDAKVYGETFAQLSFKEAIEIGILSDYKIITLLISNKEVKKLIEQNAFVKPTGKDWDKETEARTLASLIALRKAMTHYPIHHAVTFHSSIKKAEAFEQSQTMFSQAFPKFANVQSFHVSGAMPTSIRGKIVDEFAATEKGIITNAKCLTEGVDVPNIDCVLFADPRKSTVDIVQAVGRALRKKEGKEFGYVILPVFTESNNKEEIINSDAFKEILSTIRALASNDERIIEYFRNISKGTKKRNADSLIEFDIDELIAEAIDENQLIDGLQLTTWNKLAKLSWMPFEEAREFVRGFSIQGQKEWRSFSKTNERPPNIPVNPDSIYKYLGWKSYGDWLGNNNIGPKLYKFRKFDVARDFVRKLGLKSQNEWRDYCKSKNKAKDIPTSPHTKYQNDGWISYGDWLGTDVVAAQNMTFKSFNEAREFVRNLGLKNQSEWRNFIKSGKKPKDIPSSPSNTYENEGWIGFGDWLGTGSTATRNLKYKKFENAKSFVKNLNIKSKAEWVEYCKTNNKPNDIPATPNGTYKNSGWIGWGDWLGTDVIAPQNKVYKSFIEAKIFISELKLENWKEWKIYCLSGNKPNDIPNAPQIVYKEEWKGIVDFLSSKKRNKKEEYLNFSDAKEFVKSLNIKSQKEWNIFSRTKRPQNIPSNPRRIYKNKGWRGMRDWLGFENNLLKF